MAAAMKLQQQMAKANQPLPDDRRIVLRIGIKLGDVVGAGGDIYGEDVNIAARLEGLAEAGGICISVKVHEEVRGKVGATFEDMGEQTVKNIVWPVRVYRLRSDDISHVSIRARPAPFRPERPSISSVEVSAG